ncbi:MAG: YceI family protein, partial [Actinomycetota bacterium]|nr:YceI family protein [Actinomycetota bacterium]
MSTTALATAVPTGTWRLDPTHSNAGFAIKHAVVNTFRSEFKDIAATLVAEEDGTTTLTGTVQVASIDIDDPQFKGHL